MEFSLILAEQVLVMFLLLLAGGILYKCRIVKEEGLKQMTDILLYLVMPFLILDTYQIDYNAELTLNMLLGFALSVGCIVLTIFLTQVLRIGAKKEQLTTERFTVIFTNCGFMGIPLISAVFGDMGVFYGTTYLTIFNFMIWTYGLALMQGKQTEKKPLKDRLRPFCSPTMICIALGVGMYFMQLKFPEPAERAISYIASMNTPLAMLIAGMNIVRSGLLQGLKRKRLYVTAAMKCFIAPIVTLFVLALLPVDATLRMTLLIASACPTGANGIMFAGKYNGDSKVASHMFALTTLCSIISIPVVIYIGTLLIK